MTADERTRDPERAKKDLRTVERALAGDPEAISELAQRLKLVPRLLSLFNARRGTRLSKEDLEDLSQDTLVRLWTKLRTFHGRATFENWLYRFALLEFMNRIRTRMRAPRRIDVELEEIGGGQPLDAGLLQEEMERMLTRLGPPDSDVIRLKHYEDLTFEAIGQRLSVSPNTAKTQYYRGIAWLQRQMRKTKQEAHLER